jgi:hypothetical protein
MRFLALAAVAVEMMMTMPLVAQTTDNGDKHADSFAWAKEQALGFLPKADQDRVIAAHDKALADFPTLKSEDGALREEGRHLAEANSRDRIAFMEKYRIYEQKIRQAMLREDPALGPVLAEIDKHVSALKAQHQSEADEAKP